MMSPLLLLFRGQLVFEDCSCHLWNVDDLKSQSICVLISLVVWGLLLFVSVIAKTTTTKKRDEGVALLLWPPGADLQTQLNSWHPITPQNFQKLQLTAMMFGLSCYWHSILVG